MGAAHVVSDRTAADARTVGRPRPIHPAAFRRPIWWHRAAARLRPLASARVIGHRDRGAADLSLLRNAVKQESYAVRAVNRMRTPPFGARVRPRSVLATGFVLSRDRRHSLSKVASTIFISYSANSAPMQRRGPPPNGRY